MGIGSHLALILEKRGMRPGTLARKAFPRSMLCSLECASGEPSASINLSRNPI